MYLTKVLLLSVSAVFLHVLLAFLGFSYPSSQSLGLAVTRAWILIFPVPLVIGGLALVVGWKRLDSDLDALRVLVALNLVSLVLVLISIATFFL